MRRRLIESDLLECVLGLGPNLFYNSPMEACIVICRTRKTSDRIGKVLFIDAVQEVARESALSFLKPSHQERVLGAYRSFADEAGFAAVATNESILAKDGNLSIPRYVTSREQARTTGDSDDLTASWEAFDRGGSAFWQQLDGLVAVLDDVLALGTSDE
jgi:type I restriction enzyme M protein